MWPKSNARLKLALDTRQGSASLHFDDTRILNHERAHVQLNRGAIRRTARVWSDSLAPEMGMLEAEGPGSVPESETKRPGR